MEDIDYNKMKESASEFAGFLIRYELEFSQEINDFNESVAVYFDVKTRDNKVITFIFGANGYTGIDIKD